MFPESKVAVAAPSAKCPVGSHASTLGEVVEVTFAWNANSRLTSISRWTSSIDGGKSALGLNDPAITG